MTGTGKEWWYHWKAEELKRTNPSALVPTLIPVDTNTGAPDESKVKNLCKYRCGVILKTVNNLVSYINILSFRLFMNL